ncbi:MAG: hypothetical protein A2038_01370 [Deltaproteobacteria bacterium GWA2_57_13]|nr:MAG: hypothetical protein A2038_01370 [Deltaproteobacteria bacterium GWA2_57_13]
MSHSQPIREGQIVAGAQFNEPMRVETVASNGLDSWVVGLVGTQSEKFCRVTLTSRDLAALLELEHETSRGCQVYDVHEKNLGYDVTSLDLNSGELRLIEIKGIGEVTGTVLLTPNERRVAQDRRDCYWLYVVTDCKSQPKLQDHIKDPARFPWHEACLPRRFSVRRRQVKKVGHYYLSVDALTQPM